MHVMQKYLHERLRQFIRVSRWEIRKIWYHRIFIWKLSVKNIRNKSVIAGKQYHTDWMFLQMTKRWVLGGWPPGWWFFGAQFYKRSDVWVNFGTQMNAARFASSTVRPTHLHWYQWRHLSHLTMPSSYDLPHGQAVNNDVFNWVDLKRRKREFTKVE